MEENFEEPEESRKLRAGNNDQQLPGPERLPGWKEPGTKVLLMGDGEEEGKKVGKLVEKKVEKKVEKRKKPGRLSCQASS